MKKTLSFSLALLLCACILIPFTACSDPYKDIEYVDTPYAGTTLYVYNWGENIANGEDDSMNLERVFEKKYKINVEYTTYPSNEELRRYYPLGLHDCPSDRGGSHPEA